MPKIKVANKTPSKIKQFINDVDINGDDEDEAFCRIFCGGKSASYGTVRGHIKEIRQCELYKVLHKTMVNNFVEELEKSSQKAAIKYMNAYSNMIDDGDKFIKDSDGELKLKAFANQRELLKANPFQMLNSLKRQVDKEDDNLLEAGAEEGIILD